MHQNKHPDPREDLESRSPNLGRYTTKGTLKEPPLRDLLFGSSRGSGNFGLQLDISPCAKVPQAGVVRDHKGSRRNRLLIYHGIFEIFLKPSSLRPLSNQEASCTKPRGSCSKPRLTLLTQRPQSSSCLGLPYRILNMNPQKELLWGLWVEQGGTRVRF